MTDTKQEQVVNYLGGRTPRCPNLVNGEPCGRRVVNVDDEHCSECTITADMLDFQDNLRRPSTLWYLRWSFINPIYGNVDMFVCRTCGYRSRCDEVGVEGPLGLPVPVASGCWNTIGLQGTRPCSAANSYWGGKYPPGNDEPVSFIERFKRLKLSRGQ
jgi:hypothetical protein